DAFYPGSAATPAATDASGLRLFALRTDPAGGSAILAGRDGPQRAHVVGDEVAPGVILAEVHPDHAVLDAGGRRSELRFPTLAARPDARATAPAPSPVAAAPRRSPGAAPPTIDPARLLAQAGLAPVESGGRVAGYTVIPRGDD